MRRTLRLARLVPLICAAILLQPTGSFAYNKVESECVWMIKWATDKAPVPLGGYAKKFDMTARGAEAGPSINGYRHVERIHPEEKQAPRGNHGQISGIVYHAEYDPVVTIWCQCPFTGDMDPERGDG